MIQQNEQKAVLTALADVVIKDTDNKKKSAELLLLKVEIRNLKKQ